jgi:hypothetical protein
MAESRFGEDVFGDASSEQSLTEASKGAVLKDLLAVALALVLVFLYLHGHFRGAYVAQLPWEWMREPFAPHWVSFGPIFIVVLLVNPLLRLLRRKGIQSRQLSIVYAIMAISMNIVGGFVGIRTMGMMGLQYLTLLKPKLYADAMDLYSPLIFPIECKTVTGFFFGQSSVPWSHWIIPIILWTSLYLAFYLAFLCIASILRRRWSDHERLQYPIAAVMIGALEDTSSSAFGDKRSKLMYLGVVFGTIWIVFTRLVTLIPAFPYFSEGFIGNFVKAFFAGGEYEPIVTTWPGFNPIVSPIWIGVGYFVPTKVLFSVWFFYLFRLFTNVVALKLGALDGGHTWPMPMTQFMLGAVALGVINIIRIRHELKLILKSAFSGEQIEGGSELPEPVSYRFAVLLLIGVFAYMLVFCAVFLKIDPWWSAIFFTLILSMCIAIARLRAEAGVGWNGGADSGPFSFVMRGAIGAPRIGLRNVSGLGHIDTMGFGFMMSSTATTLEIYKVFDEQRIPRRKVWGLGILVFIFATVAGFITYLPFIYKVGANGFDPFAMSMSKYGLEWSIWDVKNDYYGKIGVIRWIYSGFIVFPLFLAIGESMFLWWPFSPIGYVAGSAVFGQEFAGGFFVVWLIKSLIFRYSSAKMYTDFKPLLQYIDEPLLL